MEIRAREPSVSVARNTDHDFLRLCGWGMHVLDCMAIRCILGSGMSYLRRVKPIVKRSMSYHRKATFPICPHPLRVSLLLGGLLGGAVVPGSI